MNDAEEASDGAEVISAILEASSDFASEAKSAGVPPPIVDGPGAFEMPPPEVTRDETDVSHHIGESFLVRLEKAAEMAAIGKEAAPTNIELQLQGAAFGAALATLASASELALAGISGKWAGLGHTVSVVVGVSLALAAITSAIASGQRKKRPERECETVHEICAEVRERKRQKLKLRTAENGNGQ